MTLYIFATILFICISVIDVIFYRNMHNRLAATQKEVLEIKEYLGFYETETGEVNDTRTLEQIQRDISFDERIAELDREIQEKIGSPAEELHPLVKNLPYNTIKNERFSSPPVLEIAD